MYDWAQNVWMESKVLDNTLHMHKICELAHFAYIRKHFFAWRHLFIVGTWAMCVFISPCVGLSYWVFCLFTGEDIPQKYNAREIPAGTGDERNLWQTRVSRSVGGPDFRNYQMVGLRSCHLLYWWAVQWSMILIPRKSSRDCRIVLMNIHVNITPDKTVFFNKFWYLTFTTLWAFSADDKLIFFLFFPETGFDISCKLAL